MKKIKNLLLLLFVGCIMALPIKANAATLMKSINVEGIGDIGLAKNNYTFDYATSFSYVNITATPASEGIVIEGTGQLPIQAGANQYVITASDGKNTESITINLNTTITSGSSSTVDPKSGVSYEKGATTNPETGAFLNYSLVAISILASVVVIKKIKDKTAFHRI